MVFRITFSVVAVVAAMTANAFEEIPKASAKALGVTRGRQFSDGLVFVNGKYIEPPYIVERWGTGIRINSIHVTGQVIDWSEFLKTQDPSVVTKIVPAQPDTPPVQTYMSAPEVKSDADMLDDLFDDEPTPKKPATSTYRAPVVRPKPAVPRYELVGKFSKNDASRALVKRINDYRTELDGVLRKGGVIFFGDGYSSVFGDSGTVEKMLERLPEIMQKSESLNAFRAALRHSGMVYINDILSGQLFDNKIDYRRLQERRQKLRSDREWSNMLRGVNKPLL